MTLNATQVPGGWHISPLGDVADVRRGISWTREQESSALDAEAVPVVRIGNVQTDGFHMGDTLYVRGVAEAEKVRGAISPRTLVMVGSNGNRDRVGNVFLADQRVLGHLLASFLIAVRPAENASEHFLAAVLRSTRVQRLITDSTAGSTGLKNLGLRWLRSLPILLPPLPEQRAIAAVLDGIDEAIERTEEVIAATERLRDALLHELLTRGLPGRHSEWVDVPGLGTAPACWVVVRLGEVLESTTYGTNAALQETGSTPILRMTNLQGGRIDFSELRWADLSAAESALQLEVGDILFNRTNSPDLVGKVGLVKEVPRPLAFASYLVRLRVHEHRADSTWLAALLGSPPCQSHIRRFATPGVSQANINPTSLKSLALPLPPIDEQRAIAAALDGVDGNVERAREESARLQSFQASAVDALLTGRVQVGQLAERLEWLR